MMRTTDHTPRDHRIGATDDAPRVGRPIIARPRLTEALNDGRHRRLTLISASPGSGKTTLLREWTARNELPTVMIALRHDHNDPQRFLARIDHAVATLSGQAYHGRQPVWIDQLVTRSINAMAAVPFDFALVLDNVHLLDTLAARNALTDLVEYIPPRVRLVLATREEPEIPLPRMRVRRQVIELRDEDLAFTPEETAIYTGNNDINLPASIAELHRRTEGWITGMRIAVETIDGCADCSDRTSALHRNLWSWFEQNVVEQLPPDTMSFMLRTAQLDRLTRVECDALTGRRDSHLLLDRLERKNLFVRALDDERTGHRYHSLFREFLTAYSK